MEDLAKQIADTKAELSRLDPQLRPILGPLLRDRLARLQEIRDREA